MYENYPQQNENQPESITNSTAYNPHYPQLQPLPQKNKGRGKLVGFGALIIALSFSVSMLGSAIGGQLSGNQPAEAPILQAQTGGDAAADSIITTATSNGTVMTLEQVAALAAPSVVEITTESLTTGNRMQQYVSTGAGSGVIVSADGYIVTNDHVVSGSTKLTVTLKDGTQHPATLVGTDAKTDIAVIKIEAKGLTAATVGKSSTVKVGQDAIVIGNPLGQLGGTVTNGIISALDREISIDGTVMTLLQTNAAINPGNSGGGLFNNKGELVGIVNAKSSGTDIEGIGFAIPIDTAMAVSADLMAHGYVQGRVELGMTLLDIGDPMTAMMYRVDTLGLYVYKLDSNSNAAAAGLATGDRIVAINGIAVETQSDVTTVLDKMKVGETITMKVVRGSQEASVSFVLQEQHLGTAA